MKFGNCDIAESIGKLNWKDFQRFYNESLTTKVIESPEDVYKALGGTPPTKKDKKEAE